MFPSFLKTGLSRRNFLFLIFQPFLCVQFLSLALNPPRHFLLFQLLILGCHGRFLFIQPSFLQPFPPGIPQHFPPTCPCSLFLPWQFDPFSGFHFHFLCRWPLCLPLWPWPLFRLQTHFITWISLRCLQSHCVRQRTYRHSHQTCFSLTFHILVQQCYPCCWSQET